MKILEVRDGFIIFETDNSVHLSSFVQADGIAKSYIAQVVQLKSAGNLSVASAKILFLYDGSLQPYDKTLPSRDSEIKEVTFDILSNSIDASNPIIAGKTLGNDNLVIDESSFNKKMLVSIDNNNDKNIVIRNLAKQFNNLGKDVLIIDTHGVIKANKYTAGIDFKLPLDTASLAFMYEECLNDATADSKSLIIEIFKDLSDYSKTVPFVPFEALKNIVDDMVDKSHVFKLLVLKNKLAKLDKLGCFAKNKSEVDRINAILSSKCAIVDLSKLDRAFQNRYLSFLYKKLEEKQNTQVFLELSNTVSKKNLKNIMTAEIPTVFSARSQFQYINDIKNFFDNFIITPSVTNNEIFKIYGTFLKSMPAKTYLITGEAVNYIPLVSKLENINDVIALNDEQEEIDSAVTEEPSNENFEEIAEPVQEEERVEEEVLDEIIEEEVPEKISDEEILANIEEKSDAVILEAAKDLTPPPEDMFGEEESDEEINEDTEENFEEVIEEAPEPQEEEEILPAEEDEIEEELSVEDLEDSDEENTVTENENEEVIIEGNYETIETSDNNEPELDEIEEISLEEAFDSEIPMLEEAEEEPQQATDYEEFTTDFSKNENLTGVEGPIILEMPDDFNVDLSESEIIEEQPENKDNELTELEEIPDVIPASDDNSVFDEIIELDPDEADENAIIIDMDEDDEDNTPLNDEDIVKEVDKVFTTRKDEDISDSDLDLIDELNSDDVELQLSDESGEEILEELSDIEENNGILEEPQETIDLREADENEILETKNSATPIVPVYDADIPQEDLVMSDPIAQGDSVTHAKYGSGVVEKMIKYGNKTLFSINFDNVGRRLLDPTLTEIKKN